MSEHAPHVDDAVKRAALRRIKFVAASALVVAVAILALARGYESRWPWLAFVAAFAEAAAIGGIADWYAVVALFRRPLGLPIPHTAIIPSNQLRIADNLGRFFEVNFLAPGPVRRGLQGFDFAALVSDWLSDPGRSRGLSRFVVRILPQMMRALEESNLSQFALARARRQLMRLEVAPLVANLMESFAQDRRHQALFDQVIGLFAGFLNNEEALASMRDRIRDELPTLAKLFRADAYLLKRIVRSAGALMEDAQDDPEHPLRLEFDRFFIAFIAGLRESPDYARRVEQVKRDLLARPEIATLAGELWDGLKTFVEEDSTNPDSVIGARLGELFVEAGRALAADPAIRADMNEGFVVAVASFVESRKSAVATFIADQVKAWDLGQLTSLIELNIGRDLQYIRFNGMLIGGIAGVMLYCAELLLFRP